MLCLAADLAGKAAAVGLAAPIPPSPSHDCWEPPAANSTVET